MALYIFIPMKVENKTWFPSPPKKESICRSVCLSVTKCSQKVSNSSSLSPRFVSGLSQVWLRSVSDLSISVIFRRSLSVLSFLRMTNGALKYFVLFLNPHKNAILFNLVTTIELLTSGSDTSRSFSAVTNHANILRHWHWPASSCVTVHHRVPESSLSSAEPGNTVRGHYQWGYSQS